MEHYLRPDPFDTLPDTDEATEAWRHWYKTFCNFCNSSEATTDEIKLQFLINYVSASIYSFISECTSYESAIDTLTNLYDKPQNEIHARHILTTRTQHAGETIDEYLEALKDLSKSCKFMAVTGDDYRNEYIRDAFINGLISTAIRQKLLENTTLSLLQASEQARALELVQACPQSPADSTGEGPDVEDEFPEGIERKKCTGCGRDFSNVSNLRRHVKQSHPDQLQEIAPHYKTTISYRYSCEICQKNFSFKRHLKFHLKSHKEPELPTDNSDETNKSKVCPLCGFSSSHSKVLLTHFNEVHDMGIDHKKLVFPSFDSFENWLRDAEKQTHAKYARKQTTSTKKHSRIIYACHRSGMYVYRGQGLRHMKSKVSVRINGYCPAYITVLKDNNGICHVSYIDTHVGHAPEPGSS